MSLRTITFFTLLLLAAYSCLSPVKITNQPLSQLLDTTEKFMDGDVIFTITNTIDNPENKIYIGKALYYSDTVGLSVQIPKNGIDNKGFGHGINILSIGTLSNKFLTAWSKIYKSRVERSHKFVSQNDISYVDLEQFILNTTGKKPGNLKGFRTFKLFFDDKTEDIELFLNVSEEYKVIQLREKDPEYREPLLDLFSFSLNLKR